jgi:hypothetical protein
MKLTLNGSITEKVKNQILTVKVSAMEVKVKRFYITKLISVKFPVSVSPVIHSGLCSLKKLQNKIS